MTCESCTSIDVREWHRRGLLYPGQQFSWSWTCGGEPAGTINVRAECAAVVLNYRSCGSGSNEWKSIQQRVPIKLTACHLCGVRPWFVCAGSTVTATTAGAEPLSFTALANYLPVGGAVACLMRANSRRRWIAAWSRRGKLG